MLQPLKIVSPAFLQRVYGTSVTHLMAYNRKAIGIVYCSSVSPVFHIIDKITGLLTVSTNILQIREAHGSNVSTEMCFINIL